MSAVFSEMKKQYSGIIYCSDSGIPPSSHMLI